MFYYQLNDENVESIDTALMNISRGQLIGIKNEFKLIFFFFFFFLIRFFKEVFLHPGKLHRLCEPLAIQ